MRAHMTQKHFFPCRRCSMVCASADLLTTHHRLKHSADAEAAPSPSPLDSTKRMKLLVKFAKEPPAAFGRPVVARSPLNLIPSVFMDAPVKNSQPLERSQSIDSGVDPTTIDPPIIIESSFSLVAATPTTKPIALRPKAEVPGTRPLPLLRPKIGKPVESPPVRDMKIKVPDQSRANNLVLSLSEMVDKLETGTRPSSSKARVVTSGLIVTAKKPPLILPKAVVPEKSTVQQTLDHKPSSPKSEIRTTIPVPGRRILPKRPQFLKPAVSVTVKESRAAGVSEVVATSETSTLPMSSAARVLLSGSLVTTTQPKPVQPTEDQTSTKVVVNSSIQSTGDQTASSSSSKPETVAISSDWVPLKLKKPLAAGQSNTYKGCSSTFKSPCNLPDQSVHMKAKYEFTLVKKGDGYIMQKLPLGTLEAKKQAMRLAKAALKKEQKYVPPKLAVEVRVTPYRPPPPPPPYNCRVCGKNFSKYSILQNHELTHSTERNFKCTKYPNCTYAGKNQMALWKHVHRVHKAQRWKCNVCGKILRRKESLHYHLEKLHLNRKPKPSLYCEFCDKVLRNLAMLRDHLAEHKNERKFQCADCPKRFNTRASIACHVIWHLEDRPYACDQCEATYKSRRNLQVHKMRHLKSRQPQDAPQ